ncbi:uncharacterized protein LOC115595561 isoform X2 [Sparus aurata]|nr:uncharacterized protein LOC115595561 isoform X2 [Sparus aurata]
MNPLPWMTLVFLLSARSSLAVVDQNWLTGIVSGIRAEYKIENEQFCLAANIPRDLDPKDLHQVLQNDRYERDVKDIIDGCVVYEGNNVVVAKPVESVHAEPQVLQNMKQLTSNKQNNILLIYSYLSPCGEKCTKLYHQYNIIKYMTTIIKQQQKKNVPHWSDVVFVFTRVFDSPKYGNLPTKEELKESLERLGNSGLGLQNIFRCYKPENLEFQCHSCSSNTKVSDVCVDNNFVPGQGGRSSPVRDRSRSSSSGRSSSISRKRVKYSPSAQKSNFMG